MCEIKSPDPAVRPLYQCESSERRTIDVRSSISLFHWIRRLAGQPALAPWLVSRDHARPEHTRSDREIIDAFLRFGSTAFHVCGTVRMGSDAAPCSIPQLRLSGIENVRVADTSIMPTLVSGNTNAPAMVIGLRAAEIIHQTRAGSARAA